MDRRIHPAVRPIYQNGIPSFFHHSAERCRNGSFFLCIQALDAIMIRHDLHVKRHRTDRIRRNQIQHIRCFFLCFFDTYCLRKPVDICLDSRRRSPLHIRREVIIRMQFTRLIAPVSSPDKRKLRTSCRYLLPVDLLLAEGYINSELRRIGIIFKCQMTILLLQRRPVIVITPDRIRDCCGGCFRRRLFIRKECLCQHDQQKYGQCKHCHSGDSDSSAPLLLSHPGIISC